MKTKSLLIVPMMFTLLACQNADSDKKRPTNKSDKTVSTKKLSTDSNKTHADKLARVGEILVNNPVGITHAHDLFEQALKIDPTNKKALFYSAFTEIVMAFEGSLKRAKPLYENPKDYREMLKYVKNEIKYPEFVDFIKGEKGKKKFKDLQALKKFVQNEVVDAFEAAQSKLNKIDGNVELIMTQLKTENGEDELYNCRTETETWENGNGTTSTDTYTECDYRQGEMTSMSVLPAKTATVDKKDLKVIASGIKGYATVFKIYTAYSIKGQKHLQNELKVKEIELGRSLTEEESNNIVKKYQQYMTLEKDHKMGEVVADLEGMIEVAMDLETLNNRFCDNQRREDNLIKSICFNPEARKNMQEALDMLSGPKPVSLGTDTNGNEVKILTDLSAFLKNPVQDLKDLAATEYDEEGRSVYNVEPELNGLFPNNDLLEKMRILNTQE